MLRPKWLWTVFWMRFSGLGPLGRLATRLAAWAAPPYKARRYLAGLHPQGYVSPWAEMAGARLVRGAHVFVGDRVVLYSMCGGVVELGDRAHLHRETIVELGEGGGLVVGADTHIQPRCLLASFLAPIRIGGGVQIAAHCTFYSYDHSFAAGTPIAAQPLRTQGGIVVEDDVWLGVGVTVLDGVRIGKGAVIGAGAVVKEDVPENSIAVGVPARVVGYRREGAS